MNTAPDPAVARTSPGGSAHTRRGPERHVVLRHRIGIDGAGAPVLVGGYFLAVLLVVGAVSAFADIRLSGWEIGTQLIRWFVGAIGVYLTAIYLPLYILHGRTRREVAGDTAIFAGIYAVLVSGLITAGYAVETLVYGIAGWTQTLDNLHLFGSPGQYQLIMLEYVVVLAVWIAAGALLGGAFYRNGLLGMVSIPVALAAVMAVETGTGPGHFGPLPPPLLEVIGLELGTFSPLGAVGTAVACCAVLATATWSIVRDIPIRNQAA